MDLAYSRRSIASRNAPSIRWAWLGLVALAIAAASMLLADGASAALAQGAASASPPQAPPATSPPGASAPAKPAAPRIVVLSNETTFTTVTVANDAVAIHSQPSGHSPRIGKLLFQTPDGAGLQTYLLLREEITSSGQWVQLRVPGRPNGRVGWVPRGALAGFQIVHTELVVNRAARELTLYRDGKAIYHAPVGVGKPSTPTPPGHFWITEAFSSNNPFYGPYAFATTDYSVLTEWPGGGVVGLHGTNEPSLIPGDPSHGCIRLLNSDIVHLEHLVSIGTPLLIQ